MLNRRLFLASGTGAMASGCALLPDERQAAFAKPAKLARLNMTADQLIRITVCTRPFRPAGPRLEAEKIGDKLIVHNYGHGGSGWSLSWGCAEDAAALALAPAPPSIAVIGAGVMGLTTALRLVETDVPVTIYAKDFPMETRSAKATGAWSPSSRIGLSDAVDGGFADRWERWARASYATHLGFVGALGEPVEFSPQYALFDEPRAPSTPPAHDFLRLGRRVRDMAPRWGDAPPGSHPFPVARARMGETMSFNVATYADRLTRNFLLRGGRMVRRHFPDRAAATALPEPVIVNCSGYGAKTLWNDHSLAPVRGQINWLAPQHGARYKVYYRDVSVVSRRDGVVVQYVGPNDDWGYGDASETPDRDEMEMALAAVAPLFET